MSKSGIMERGHLRNGLWSKKETIKNGEGRTQKGQLRRDLMRWKQLLKEGRVFGQETANILWQDGASGITMQKVM